VNGSYKNDHHRQDLLEPEERDREISLGTSMILGIFLGLALLCAVFFGFGYSMGRHSAQVVAGSPDSTVSEDTGGSKPSPGSPASHGASASHGGEDAGDGSAAPSGGSAAASGNPAPAVVVRSPVSGSQSAASSQPPANPGIRAVSLGRPAPAAAAAAPVAVPGVGSVIVQIAAVSHQEDANMLVSELKKHGYNVTIRQEPQDKLLHVQVGPFANKKDAEAMRQRLLADGYKAIVK
jgi:DedD protein